MGSNRASSPVVPLLFQNCLTSSLGMPILRSGTTTEQRRRVWEKRFSATLSVTGRTAWAVIFPSSSSGRSKYGRFLGYEPARGSERPDETEANDLKDQLNQLLADESFWSLPAKAEAGAAAPPNRGNFSITVWSQSRTISSNPRVNHSSADIQGLRLSTGSASERLGPARRHCCVS